MIKILTGGDTLKRKKKHLGISLEQKKGVGNPKFLTWFSSEFASRYIPSVLELPDRPLDRMSGVCLRIHCPNQLRK